MPTRATKPERTVTWYHAALIGAAARPVSRIAPAVLFVVLGCGAKPTLLIPKATPAPTPQTAAPWPRFAECLAWPPVNEQPFVSQGHRVAPNHAVVRVSPESRDAYLGLVSDTLLPEGATVLFSHQSADATEPGVTYLMEKKAGIWAFVALGPNGAAIAADLRACAGCHAEGVADALFGLPRTPSPPKLPQEAPGN